MAGDSFQDRGPVEVPYLIVFKLVTRYARLKRLRRAGATGVTLDREYELIEAALTDLKAFAVERDYVNLEDSDG